MAVTREEGTRSGGSKQCPLCLDALSRPACVPCGHIFCWDCILTYVVQKQQQQSNGSTDSGNSNDMRQQQQQHEEEESEGRGSSGAANSGRDMVRCPVCRVDFKSQRVRALYEYV